MAEQKPALVLHLAAGGEPLLFALAPEESAPLGEKLVELITTGAVESVRTNDGSVVAINFKHVTAAYIDDLQRKGRVFGLH
jgi:hypothetical protein